MDSMDKMILDITQRAKNTNDPRVLELAAGTLSDVDFIKGLTADSPYYIRNGVLTTIDDPVIVEEIKRMQTYMASNPPGLRVDGNVMMAKESEVLRVFPELSGAYQKVKDALNDAKCVGCARNKELQHLQEQLNNLHRTAHNSGTSVRDVSGMLGVAGQAFVDAWKVPPPAPNAPVNLARMSWAPTKGFQTVGEHLSKLQTPVSLTPPGHKMATAPVIPPPRSALVPPMPPTPPARPAFRSADKNISVPMVPPEMQVNQFAQPELPQGMRKPCKDCYRKHLMQAKVLLDETLKGYPEHIWLAIGHLSEAEDEVIGEDMQLANATRDLRLQIMQNPFIRPDLLPLLYISLKGDDKWAAWSNPQK